MADITKCSGIECPVKDKCYRYMAEADQRQSWFLELPGSWIESDGKQVWKCDMYWGESQNAIMDMLMNIVNGTKV